jgi:hypothetical protein
MSAAALVLLSPESKSAAKSSSKRLRVNDPGDAFEREADKVADTVAGGGRIAQWSLSSSGAGLIQRDPNTAAAMPTQASIRMIGDPQDPPAPNNYGDAAGKLAEALKETPAGKAVIRYLTDQPIVKDAKDFVETPAGIAVVGSTAIATIAGLAAAGKSLPMQIPQLPLGTIAGIEVKAKIDVEGPLNHPTQGSLMFSFGSAPPKKQKDSLTNSEKYRAETARMAEQMKFGVGVDPGKLGPGSGGELEKQADDKRAQDYAVSRMSAILQPNAPHTPGQFTPLAPRTQPMSLRMRDDIPAADPATPAASKDASKKEEISVQRKAERMLDVLPDAVDVESVLSSNGQPLDRETRRFMESRIGFDFGKVRIHTDARAGASARLLGARAYTVGNDVVFAPGRFAPQTIEGRRLLAHELTHVVQQSPNRAAMPPAIRPAPVHIQRDAEEDAKKFSLIKFAHDPWGALGDVADGIPGYTLFTVIIKYDPIRKKHVERNPTSLIGGFLKLINKEETFKNLKESGAIDKAFQWLDEKVAALGLSVSLIEDLIKQAITAAKDASGGLSARLSSAYAVFQPTLRKVIEFAGEVLKKVGQYIFEGALQLIGGTGVLEIIHDASDAISAIIRDPFSFVGNLVKALQQGVNQFGAKILDYLQKGVMTWLFGKIGKVDFPKTITPGSLFNLVLDVLGLNYKSFRKQLVAELGSEEAVVIVEKGFDILQTIVTKGFGAAWQKVLEEAGNVLDSLLSAAKEWAVTKVVTIAITQLIKLVNPAGAVIAAIQAIYTTLKVFIDKAKQIVEIIKAISSSISKIAAGNVGDAANSVETAMGNTIPIVIGFLADFLGLGDIAETVHGILEGVKAKIAAGVRKFVAYIVKMGKGILAKGQQAVAKILDWWKQRKDITEGNEKHTIYLDGTEDRPMLMVASVPGISWTDFLEEKSKTATPAQKTAIDEIKVKATELEKRLPPSKSDDEKAKNVEAKRQLFEDVATRIAALGLHHDATDPASLINYAPVRASDEGGMGADASVLTPKHPPGSEPNDEPKIWTSLGSLIQKKNYVQGHLLNHNLGGEGRRFNLSPINKKANSDHLNQIEKTVKKAVNTDKKVVSYKVNVEYGSHAEKPKRLQELEAQMATRKLSPDEETELKEFQAEQRLCTSFRFEMAELLHNGTEWAPKPGVAPVSGDVQNKIEV